MSEWIKLAWVYFVVIGAVRYLTLGLVGIDLQRDFAPLDLSTTGRVINTTFGIVALAAGVGIWRKKKTGLVASYILLVSILVVTPIAVWSGTFGDRLVSVTFFLLGIFYLQLFYRSRKSYQELW